MENPLNNAPAPDLSDMIDEERRARELALKKVADELGDDARTAIEAHLSLARERYYEWLASLYVPRRCVCESYDSDGYRICRHPRGKDGNYLCQGGGFYYSNSARDTDGYEIDLESTIQAMSFAVASGMLDSMSSFDRQIGYDAAAFAKSLQDPDDGYFYHPQWGKSITESRRGRDLDWATKLLRCFGVKPYYNTPSGLIGELGAPSAVKNTDADAKESDTQGSAVAWPWHLCSIEAFVEYLRSFDLASKSYSAGNTLTAMASQIVAREKAALNSGELSDTDGDGIADHGYIRAFESYMNSMQNSDNGLWEARVHYNSVNGLMKIGSAYNKLGIAIPNVRAAFNSAVEMILLPASIPDVMGKLPTASVDVFNPWIAIIELMQSIDLHGALAQKDEMRLSLRQSAASLIRTTTEKTKKFEKPDGTFGYTWSCSPYKSQGAPVCPEGNIEGDVNGGGIALNGIWLRIAAALGIPISIYSRSDGVKFSRMLAERMKK